MAEPNRDTIYIDIDDEITGIIDKLRSSDSKIVALVLPKRASVFQSVVNMKLLKRASDQAKKRIVLITAEAGLLPLAGAVGIHVAKTLASKPEVPSAPVPDDGREEMVEETASLEDENPDELTTATAGFMPVGELAALGGAATAAGALPADGVETIELDDEDEPTASAAAPLAAAAATPRPSKKPKKNKNLKIPNFERFRLLIILLVILVVVLIPLLYLALSVLPKAAINIQTDASNVNTNVNLSLDSNASALNTQTNTVPAKQVQEQKTYTGSAPATGQQNNGQSASGSVTMSAQECGSPVQPSDVPAGTGVSANGQTYITQGDTSFNPSKVQHNCIYFTSNGPTNITAQKAGATYNTGDNTTFTVAGRTDVTATGSASGGTDNIQQVVQQSDIANAQAKINVSSNTVKQDLEQQLQQDNLYPIPATFTSTTPSTSPSTNAGGAASSVTVTESIAYSMYGVPASDLHTLLTDDIKSLVNTGQGILTDGLSNASFTTTGGSGNVTNLTMSTTAEVGPNINVASIKTQAAGKKSGDVIATVKNDSDVTNVTVHLSPFWVTSVPKNLSKITVNIAKPTAAAN